MRHPVSVTVLALASLAAVAGLFPVTAQEQQVFVHLELAQEFYYEDDPLNLQISVRNPTGQTQPNPIKVPLFEGFRVRPTGGELLKAQGQAGVEEPSRPESLSPGGFYGAVFELTEIHPRLKTEGVYEIYWGGGGVVSQMIVVTILPRYDPAKSYSAQIDTAFGPIEIAFLQERSPIAVKSFVDMARVGLYDGLQFQEIHADSYVVGGDPVYADRPRRAITFPAELSSVPLVAGTIVMKPVSASPPANGPAFMIMLKPQPAWTGQVTVLGQVVKGLDVVRKISNAPSTQRTAKPFYKPLEPIGIRKVTVREMPIAERSP